MGIQIKSLSLMSWKAKKLPISDSCKDEGGLGIKTQLVIHWAHFNS